MSALQLVAGSFEPATRRGSICSGCAAATSAGRPADPALVYDLYAHAKSLQAQYRLPFAQAFDLAFWETIAGLRQPRRLSRRDLAAGAARGIRAGAAGELRPLARPPADQPARWRSGSSGSTSPSTPTAASVPSRPGSSRSMRTGVTSSRTMSRSIPRAAARWSRWSFVPAAQASLLTTLLEYRIAPGGHDDAIEAAAYGFASMVAFTPRVRAGRHVGR